MGGSGESELAVGSETFAGHGYEHGHGGVVVVVHDDVNFGGVSSQEPADVLDDAAFEGHGERENEGVEAGKVEAFAEVAAGGEGDDRSAVADLVGELVDDVAAVFAGLSTDEEQRGIPIGTEQFRECVEVVFALGKHQHPSTVAGQGSKVVHDETVAGRVVRQGSEHVLDVWGFLFESEPGGVHVEVAGEFGAGGVRGGNLVADGAAVERDERIEPVGPERGRGEPDPTAGSGRAQDGLVGGGGRVIATERCPRCRWCASGPRRADRSDVVSGRGTAPAVRATAQPTGHDRPG